ncbi:MAG TPA: histone deacetylase family protein [Azoarcus sp.]|nr:histone deacetylase family protein [Azoarcus sp.]
MSTLIFSHPACYEHQPGSGHPESPARLKAVIDALKQPEFSSLQWREAPLGTREQVLLVHTEDYVSGVEEVAPSQGTMPLDGGDTVMSPGSMEAVMRCVGAACTGVDVVLAGEVDNVFCATRPCGHHATPNRAMGFCIYNQAAIAGAYARERHLLERVAVVDFDVHHGNGTQDAFYEEPGLFYASTHQAPLYPGTGLRSETGAADNIVNVPLPPGCDSATFRDQVTKELLPKLRAFNPELLIISAGFDAHTLDPLAGLNFTDDDYRWVTEELKKVAEECCGGKIVSILEGGYSLEGLASGTAEHVKALMS